MSRELSVDIRFTFSTEGSVDEVEGQDFRAALAQLINDVGSYFFSANGYNGVRVEFVSAGVV